MVKLDVVRSLRVLALVVIATGAAALSASAAPHSFELTYRAFGPVKVESGFKSAQGYEVRSEGCYARRSEEAICAFTLRALRPLIVTNLRNVAHGSGTDGSSLRTCCMFVQGDNRGFPITTGSSAPAEVAVLNQPLRPGQEIGLMLRVPDYRKAAPLADITFSHGDGDIGISFPEHVTELP